MNKDKYTRFVAGLKAGIEAGKIKVHVTIPPEAGGPAGESLWANPIGKKYAKISNIPFYCPWIGMDDIVEINQADREFIRVISRGSITGLLAYKKGKSKQQTQKNFDELTEYLKAKNIGREGMVPGLAAIALPVDMDLREAAEYLDGTPHLKVHTFQDIDPDTWHISPEEIEE